MLQPLTRFVFLFSLLFLGSCARENYFQKNALYTASEAEKLAQPEPGFVWATAGKHYQRSKVHTFIWGKHYRDVWATPVAVPILNLTQISGGLVPSEIGGGLQTTSLTLVNSEGRSFTLRTLDKDPVKSLSPFWQKTFISNIMRDQTSAINPYGAFTVPPLAKAGEIFHTNPDLFYVPAAGSGLGKFQELFAGKLVMLEEKFENKESLTPNFGKATQVINSKKLFREVKSSHHNQVDQLAFARARLFDILIMDLDRHEGQWNWAEYRMDAGTVIYKPIPKDRDYAYYQFADGLIPWLLTRRVLVGKMKAFIHNIPDVAGLAYKGRELDKKFLSQISAEEWAQVAKELQSALSQPVIQEAMSRFPHPVNQGASAQISKKLTQRVNNLPQLADEYYQLLASNVKVLGSEKREKFIVKQLPDKTTLVEVFTLPETPGESPRLLYHRIFTYQDTKKITLDGVGNKDEFVVDKPGKRTPVIKIKERKSKTELMAEGHKSK
ncbi:hypothetical protein AAE02nite_13420 [Adhaeribacter aerolatus]|uniref:Lipoprotein n=1 Tax=Adhaeribacter aerolatus TaxID=670289 RepID=A0A512AVF2_9BACT|nr:hypothetical protein [Adhaeribacter aerolatus]GEO03678.1 hypothetical protein AAE02nite_13420 [Adhaeribacter aerolatus]